LGPKGALSNQGDDPTGLYHEYARINYGEMLARHPELKDRFAWGGAFGTQLGGGGPPDLMHFDLSGDRGHWTQNRMRNMGALPGLAYGAHIDGSNAHKSAEAIRSTLPNIGAAIGGTDTDRSKERTVRGSLEAIRQGQQDDLRSGLTGGRFGTPRPSGTSTYDRLRAEEQFMELKGQDRFDYLKPRGGEQRASYDLLHAHARAVLGGDVKHSVEGKAHLTVDVNGPAGTQAKMKSMEGMFKDARINRGVSMPRASENG
jgi:hypothetical protein